MLKFAAIDIGSNAIRMQVSRVTLYEGVTTFKKLEYLRFPLRLGQDVFSEGRITEAAQAKFIKLMQAFKILIDLYEVDDYMACATSAMRDSTNGGELVEKVKKQLGLKIQVINGDEEAEIINRAIFPYMDHQSYLHIDVGGGSTELNLYVAHQKVAAHSFQLGSVRRSATDSPSPVWEEVESWIKKQIKVNYGKMQAIGTGGNINKVLEITGKKPGKAVSLTKIKSVQDYIAGFSMEDRINKLQLNPDRADVIGPALDIYMKVMKLSKATSIIVPDSGMKDGMMQLLYEKNQAKLY